MKFSEMLDEYLDIREEHIKRENEWDEYRDDRIARMLQLRYMMDQAVVIDNTVRAL